MSWSDELLEEQKKASSHVGSHARLLAGPGTGKTRVLSRRICYLVQEQGTNPEDILVLTFTRAAASELRQRVVAELGSDANPQIRTIHSYALRQLLQNPSSFTNSPSNLHIADDWEERHLIYEDIKSMLNLATIQEVRELFARLSADWETLAVEEPGWDDSVPNPAFIGAWHQHRRLYSYMLRSELVYQLKRNLEQDPGFKIDGPPSHLLVDEYQDLNPCDLAVIKQVVDRGAELFIAGDDDQSIYGFRKGDPSGIRRFAQDYDQSTDLHLTICKRCASEILELALWVARQDYARIDKELTSDTQGGEVALLHFANQNEEAHAVAEITASLLRKGLLPGDILILTRTDHNQAFSDVLRQELNRAEIPVAIAVTSNPFDHNGSRQILATLRLVVDLFDNLAWRTLLQLRKNGIGEETLGKANRTAIEHGFSFYETMQFLIESPGVLGESTTRKLRIEMSTIGSLLATLAPSLNNVSGSHDLKASLDPLINMIVVDEDTKKALAAHLHHLIDLTDASSATDLLKAIDAATSGIEQELDDKGVNILTMHQAKGLTAEAVFVVAAEQEYLPGRANGSSQIGDERRLLYVSLTRAKKYLIITHCHQRTGRQLHTGAASNTPRRHLTEFLQDGPVKSVQGRTFLSSLS